MEQNLLSPISFGLKDENGKFRPIQPKRNRIANYDRLKAKNNWVHQTVVSGVWELLPYSYDQKERVASATTTIPRSFKIQIGQTSKILV